MKDLRICMAQMDVTPAQPHKNVDRAIEFIKRAKKDRADVVVFSEALVPGYILGDMWERESFIDDCNQASMRLLEAAAEHGIYVVFGSITSSLESQRNEDGRIRKHNVCLASDPEGLPLKRHDGIQRGNATVARRFSFPAWQILKNYTVGVKTLMPNYREFDDSRHFFSNEKEIMRGFAQTPFMTGKEIDIYFNSFMIKEFRVGFILCEDGWDADYAIKPIERLAKKSDMIFNLSCSPYTYGKNDKRNRVFSAQAKKYSIPIVYVNNIGCQNNGKNVFVFDGDSCIYDKDGSQIKPYAPFEEGCDTININPFEDFGSPVSRQTDNMGKLYQAIRYGTKKYMEQNGIKKVVIGASGGIDSCLSAAIYADILDPKDLLLINMPYKYNSNTTINIAEQLAKNIGCNYISHPIGGIVDTLKSELHFNSYLPDGQNLEMTPYIMENIQARARLQVLASYASLTGGVFTCNSNKSEATIGYCTLYGDLAGWMANILDLWKTEVYEMAGWYNRNIKDVIPQGAFDVKPSAELSPDQNVDEGKGDPLYYPYHDQLFKSWVERWERCTPEEILKWHCTNELAEKIDYDEKANKPLSELFESREAFIEDLERWWNLFNGLSMAKRAWAAPPILLVKRRGFGFDLRESTSPQAYTSEYESIKKGLLWKEGKNEYEQNS